MKIETIQATYAVFLGRIDFGRIDVKAFAAACQTVSVPGESYNKLAREL